jgi:phage repressor protein C with HTH and peptisase S24 domain
MLAHEEVWTAIDALAQRNGLSPSGLARRSGLDPTTFNKSKRYAADGRPRWPSTESIAKILRATNTSINDLFSHGSQPVSTGEGIAVPLLGDARAGFDPTATPDDAIMLPSPPRVVTFPDKRYEPLFALEVTGDSMEPLYRNGDVLFIAPNAKTQPGDRVVVKLKNDEVIVKVLKSADDAGMSFHAVNPDHPDVAFSAADVEWIAKIVYATQ